MKGMHIYAKKANGQTTQFSKGVWEAMTGDRNGWTQITEAVFLGSSSKEGLATAPTVNIVLFDQLIKQAEGLMADGKLNEALSKLEQAKVVQVTLGVMSLIDDVKKQLEEATTKRIKEEQAEIAFNELSDAADKAFSKKNMREALKLYSQAEAIKKDERIAAQIVVCDAAVVASLLADLEDDLEDDLMKATDKPAKATGKPAKK